MKVTTPSETAAVPVTRLPPKVTSTGMPTLEAQNIGQAKDLLVTAQQACEELYLDAEE